MPGPPFRWVDVTAAGASPGPRSRHVMAHDPWAGATVLFGGIRWPAGRLLSDTWELRDGRWERVRCWRSPSARQRAAVAYDEAGRRAVLFGGSGRFRLYGDTWGYAGRRWRRLDPPGPTPPPRYAHGLAADPAGGLVLFGGGDAAERPLGDTWVFDGGRWERVTGPGPPARLYLALASDPDLGGCVLNGGTEGDSPHRRFADTWLFRRGRWERLGDRFEADDRDDHGLAYHHTARRLVMLDGLGGRGLLTRGPERWEPSSVDPSHPRHQCAPLVWDASLGGLVLHGGETGQEGHQFSATLLLRPA